MNRELPWHLKAKKMLLRKGRSIALWVILRSPNKIMVMFSEFFYQVLKNVVRDKRVRR